MSLRVLIKCDGPKCIREIDSTIHAGTWLTLKTGDVFERPDADNYKLFPDRHFCSHYCLGKHVDKL